MPVAWILNHYAGGPGLGSGWRHWEIGRRWVRRGIQVRIFAASTRIGGARDTQRTGTREIEGVAFRFVPARAYRGNGIGRAANMLQFARRTAAEMAAARRNGERPDVIIASSPQPLVWPAAARAARSMGVPLVPDIRDAWPESLRDLAGCSALNPLVLASTHALRAALRQAALVTSPLPNAGLHLAEHGFADVPWMHVPNGITMPVDDAADIPEAAAQAIARARAGGRRVALYAGAMGGPNALADLVRATDCLPEAIRARLAFLMIGAGTERARLERECRSAVPATFEFLGELEQPVVQAIARRCDAGVVLRTPHAVYRFGTSPQKLAMYLACGLPVVCSSTDPSDAVARHGLGWWVPAGDVTALSSTIGRLAAAGDAELGALSRACEEHARRELDWDAIAERLLERLPMAGAR
jgi:glycosyltransferase involved in cell wall biosynthesis